MIARCLFDSLQERINHPGASESMWVFGCFRAVCMATKCVQLRARASLALHTVQWTSVVPAMCSALGCGPLTGWCCHQRLLHVHNLPACLVGRHRQTDTYQNTPQANPGCHCLRGPDPVTKTDTRHPLTTCTGEEGRPVPHARVEMHTLRQAHQPQLTHTEEKDHAGP